MYSDFIPESHALSSEHNQDARRHDLDVTGRHRTDRLQPWVVDTLAEGRRTDQRLVVDGCLNSPITPTALSRSSGGDDRWGVGRGVADGRRPVTAGVPLMARAAVSAAESSRLADDARDPVPKSEGGSEGTAGRRSGLKVGWVAAGTTREKQTQLCWHPNESDTKRLRYKKAADVLTSTGALSSKKVRSGGG